MEDSNMVVTSSSDDDAKEGPNTSKNSYKDYSRLPPLEHMRHGGVNGPAKEPTFPVKLHMILSNPDHQDVIAWLPHGRSWRILKQKEFQEEVIPLYFRHGQYSSFSRQVNGWGFKRIMSGCDYNSYYNPMFLRGLPHLCDRMRRLTSKDMAKRKKESAEEPPPDLYNMSRDHPLPDSADTSKTTPLLPPESTAKTGGAAAVHTTLTGILGGDDEDLAELAAIEKRKMEILRRIEAKARGALPPPASASTMDATTAATMQQPQDRNSQIQALLQALGQRGQTAPSVPPPQPQQQQQQQQQQQAPNLSAMMPQMLQVAQSMPNGLASLNNLLQNATPQNQPVAQTVAAAPQSQVNVAQLIAKLTNSQGQQQQQLQQQQQQLNPITSAMLFNNGNAPTTPGINLDTMGNNAGSNDSNNNNANGQDVSKLLLSLMNSQRSS